MKLFFDGGCDRDGRLVTAVVARGHAAIRTDWDRGTSSDAEWLALIAALETARSLDLPDIVLIGDSADVIAKAKGLVRSRGASAAHHARFRALAGEDPPRIRLVKRSQNLAGIALARLRAR